MPRGLTAEYSMTATSYKRAWHSRPPPSGSASRPSSRARIRCPLRRTTPRALSVDTLPVAGRSKSQSNAYATVIAVAMSKP